MQGHKSIDFIHLSEHIYNLPLLFWEAHVHFTSKFVKTTTQYSSWDENGIGHYCSHMVGYDEVGYCCGKHEIVFFSFAKTYDLIFCLNKALGNTGGNLIMVKLSS